MEEAAMEIISLIVQGFTIRLNVSKNRCHRFDENLGQLVELYTYQCYDQVSV